MSRFGRSARWARWAVRGLAAFALAIGLFALGWRCWRGPAPAELLASLEVPPAPVLSPEEELASFRTATGFRVELVAAEPLVVDPVAMDWDDRGRLYVAEMRGFMGDIDGAGEERPTGRIVVLEDTDGDGRMDRSDVFLDGLVLPRAVAVLPQGVLVAAPPDLWLCRPRPEDDRACGEQLRLTHYATEGANPEHQENGLLAGLDGWIYNAKSSRRFRLAGESDQSAVLLEIEETVFRGQWGIAQDDAGRLYYNHNSAFLYGDAIPGEYAMRQPSTAAATNKPGVEVALSEDAEVYGVRVAPGLNRADLAGTLRRDGRQRGPTGVSGLAIQRGDQFGPEYIGHAFVPEAAGAAVAHFALERDGLALRSEHRLYDDPDWGQREFLASTDERFRPVEADFGPDGAIWLIDMYRGVIQHAHFVSDHLRRYVEQHALAAPGATGRIWRIVREDRPLPRRAPPLETLEQQLAALDHPNGWARDRAQRRIVFEQKPEAAAALRELDRFGRVGRMGRLGRLGRRHALHALASLGALDVVTWKRALGDADAAVRGLALRLGEEFYTRPAFVTQGAMSAIEALRGDPDEAVRIQALHTLGSLPPSLRPLDALLEAGRGGDPLLVQAAISGLAGLELRSLRGELSRTAAADPDDAVRQWLEQLAAAAHAAAREHAASDRALRRVLDLAASPGVEWQQRAVLAGIDRAQRTPGSRRIELAAAHRIFQPGAHASDEVAATVDRVRRHFTWPGDPRPGGARALTPEEEVRRARGRELFIGTCADCHGREGQGRDGLAPPLVGSPWVRDADDWLVRIALHGLTGPLQIDGEHWNATMPGHGYDSRFDDEGLAGLLTHLRRAWGHAEEPVAPKTVARIRSATGERALPWTVDELLALPVDHRLDRYAGIYEIPLVGFELEVRREGSSLMLGMVGGPSGALQDVGDGRFESKEVSIEFDQAASGSIEGASLERDGARFPVSKVR